MYKVNPVPKSREPPNHQGSLFVVYRFRAKTKQLETVEGLLPESQGQNLALTVLYVPYSLDSCLPELTLGKSTSKRPGVEHLDLGLDDRLPVLRLVVLLVSGFGFRVQRFSTFGFQATFPPQPIVQPECTLTTN